MANDPGGRVRLESFWPGSGVSCDAGPLGAANPQQLCERLQKGGLASPVGTDDGRDPGRGGDGTGPKDRTPETAMLSISSVQNTRTKG